MKKIIRAIIKVTGFLSALIYFKPKIRYSDKKEFKKTKKGKVIVASNHINYLDFVLFLLIFWNRHIRCLVGETLYEKNKFLKWLLNIFESIKVERSNFDMSFLSKAIGVLENDGMLEIYPEAIFKNNNPVGDFKLSTVYIAYHSKSKIIPIYHKGNYGIFKREKVFIGKPFDIREYLLTENPSIVDFQKVNDILEREIRSLSQYNKGAKNDREN
ncbi:1-acyl-sn-glycerol-3-phosphate acyltransferase [Acholeplasma sp. OttesenSCG-928-E16]|nr:1-acyl-sn-glycerol-3-phosphate acyltransferase [Acholeplasma sp. OttesenSCG-928-E16]